MPFAIFRRYQKRLLAVLAVFAMVAFTLDFSLLQNMTGQGNANPEIARIHHRTYRRDDLAGMKVQRSVANRFMASLLAMTGQPASAPYFGGMDDRSIVDIGGSLHYWRHVKPEIKPKQVMIYNIALDNQFDAANAGGAPGNIQASVYDGKHIPASDKQIDVLICNSVIEHVPPAERNGLAREIMRAARNYIIQTPAKVFPLEPHFVMPFLHWLSRRIGRTVVKFSPFGLIHRDSSLTQTFCD